MIRCSVEAPLAALHTWICRYSDCPVEWRPSAFGHFQASPQMFEFWPFHSGTSQSSKSAKLRPWKCGWKSVDQILVLSGVFWSWNEDGDGWLSSASSPWFRVTLDSSIQTASSEKNPGGSKRLPFNIQSAEGNQERWKVPGAEIRTLMFQFLINLLTKSGLLIIDWDEDDL